METIKSYFQDLNNTLSINPILARQEIGKNIEGKIKMIPVRGGADGDCLEVDFIANPQGILEKHGLIKTRYSQGIESSAPSFL